MCLDNCKRCARIVPFVSYPGHRRHLANDIVYTKFRFLRPSSSCIRISFSSRYPILFCLKYTSHIPFPSSSNPMYFSDRQVDTPIHPLCPHRMAPFLQTYLTLNSFSYSHSLISSGYGRGDIWCTWEGVLLPSASWGRTSSYSFTK